MTGKVLIKGGTVLSLDRTIGNVVGADVLIEDGTISEVGLSLRGERCGKGDQDGVGTAQLVVVGRRREAPVGDVSFERLRGHVFDVALAAVELGHPLGLDVDEHDRLPRLGEDVGEWHADVTGADDGDRLAQGALRV